MARIIHRIDTFANEKHKGNPAGIYVLQEDLSDTELQRIAFNSKLPVTSFLKSLPGNKFNIRWFTMNCEVNLCGHGTVAATYWLFKEFNLKEIHFQSKSGSLTSSITDDGKIEMDFPALETSPCNEATKKEIEKILGTTIKNCHFGYEDFLIELESSQAVVEFVPDFNKIKQMECRGIIITAWDDHYGYNCVSRFFCPRVAIDEDQVCVSAHCKILPYWQEKKGVKYLHAWQASSNSGELELYTLESNRVRILANAKMGESVIV